MINIRLVQTFGALFLLAGIPSLLSADPSAVRLQAAPGWVIFDASKGGTYRYGPSLIVNQDGSIDAWFASPGGKGLDGSHQWDWIRYKHSNDGGHHWTPEQIVLKPTERSRDQQSVCDPGAIKIGEWYYLGVTAVEDPKGNCNEVFVARSHRPYGPFDKWNGTGWGGTAPQPILAFRAPSDVWGLGEPSFVLKDNQLFIYYTKSDRNSDGFVAGVTMVATAPADDPNWPAHISKGEQAFGREYDEDSADVKFDDTSKFFLAVSTASRFKPASYVNYRWSSDGTHFSGPSRIAGDIMARCHNVGISGTEEGHLDRSRQNFVAYAYSTGERPEPSWGYWNTFLNPLTYQP